MLRGQTTFYGWAFFLLGVLGFVPGVTVGGFLFGVFHVNPALNLVHLATGAVLLWASIQGECSAMRVFQAAGVVYGLLGLVGLLYAGSAFVGPLALNPLDTLLHLFFAAVALFFGFVEPVRHPVRCSA